MLRINDDAEDYISTVKFSDFHEGILLSASWDASLKIFDTNPAGGALKAIYRASGPVQDAAWSPDGRTVLCTGLSRVLERFDLEYDTNSIVGGQHEEPVKSLVVDNRNGFAITGSWDASLQQIDLRSSDHQFFQTQGKVYDMDLVDNLLAVAHSNRRISLFDTRHLKNPLEMRETPLKYGSRCIKLSPDKEVYVVSGVDGRVAVEYVSESQRDMGYAFKSHKIKTPEYDLLNPVHAIEFHPKFGTFFTGGSDGHVCLWDRRAKKRMKQFNKLPASVMAMDLNDTGDRLAVAIANDDFISDPLNMGQKKLPDCGIYIQHLSESDVRGKV
ncbi:mRNA export factor Gle2p [Trichomonascus vanleenenianus]|uniref:mRNA export factor Gle2p n=1 Tax=Trichomonascus vanleenenianus TaxID=2268995 RepID=UPI003ECA001F